MLLPWEKQLLMKSPHAFGSHLAKMSDSQESLLKKTHVWIYYDSKEGKQKGIHFQHAVMMCTLDTTCLWYQDVRRTCVITCTQSMVESLVTTLLLYNLLFQ